MVPGYLLAVVGLLGASAVPIFGDCGNTTFNATSAKITVQDPGKGQNCTYYIVASTDTPQVALTFGLVALDPSLFNLTVYAGNVTDQANSKMIANLTQVVSIQPFSLVVSRYKVTSLVLSRANMDATFTPFDVTYNGTGCTAPNQDSVGSFLSPIYLPNNGTVQCSYTGSISTKMVGVLSFSSWNISKGSVDVQFGADTKSTVTGLMVPADVFGSRDARNVTLNVTIESSETLQSFRAVFMSLSPDCSGIASASSSLTKFNLPITNSLPVICYARIEAEAGSQIYLADSGNYTQTQALDSIVYYDGNNTRGSVVGSPNDGLTWHVSSGRYLTIVANLQPQVSRATNIQYKADGNSKYMVLNNSSVVVDLDGKTVQGSQVSVVFDGKNTSLTYVMFQVNDNTSITDAVVTVRCEHDMVLFNLTKATAKFPVVMPSSKAFIVVNGLGGDQKLSLNVTPVQKSDCNQVLMEPTGQILLVSANTTLKKCNILVSTDNDVILDLSKVNLCKTGKLDIYQGFNVSSPKVAFLAAGVKFSNFAPIRFPAGAGPRLEWNDEKNECAELTVVGRYWTQDNAATCGVFGTELSGTVSTPNYPNQYPLNVNCTWPVPATTNSSMLYLRVDTADFQNGQNITVQNTTNVGTLAVVNGTALPGDFLISNRNLSIVFLSGSAGQLTNSGQGAQLTYKIISCGGLVNSSTGSLPVPDARNKSVECIWIIQVPANGTKGSVNVVNASILVTGYKNADNGTLEIYDGNSMRNPPVSVNMTSKDGSNVLSRDNTLVVRYVYTNSTSGPFTLKFSFTIYNCNSSSLCDNGVCIHPEWRCDGVVQCRDGKDEKNCNGTQPIPPEPHSVVISKGVAGIWVFICIIIGIVLGIILSFAVPKIIGKIRRRNIARSSNYGSLHEDT